MPNSKITVVLVHGAWAECASWTQIIVPLQNQGLDVVCAPLPLTSLGDDVVDWCISLDDVYPVETLSGSNSCRIDPRVVEARSKLTLFGH